MAWRKPKDFRDWIRTIFRHKKKFFFPAVAVMIVVFLASQKVPREYTAEAQFTRVNDPALMQMGSRTIDLNILSFRKSLNEDIRGRAAVEQLVEDLNLTRGLPHNTTSDGELTAQGQLAKYEMVRQIASRINIRTEVSSENMDQVRITYTDPRRDMAPKVVNKIVESYISNTRKQLDSLLLSAKVFFDGQVSTCQSQVSQLTEKKLRFLADHPGLQPDDPSGMQAKSIAVQAALAQVKSDLNIAKGKAAALAEYVKSQPETIVVKNKIQNPEVAALMLQKTNLESQLSVQINQYNRTEFHPAVIAIRKQLAELNLKIAHTQAEVDGNNETQPNVNRMAAEEHLRTLEGEITAMTRDVEEKTREVDKYEMSQRDFYGLRNEYEKILRDLDEAASQLKFWDDNLRHTTMALTIELRQQGVRLRPGLPAPDYVPPSKPTLVGIVAAALVLGLGVGGLMVLISELLDHSFRNVEHAVDDLKLPILGTVNEIVTPQEAFRRKVLNTSFYPAIGGVMVLILMASLFLAYMSLEMPDRFDLLTTHPATYFADIFIPGPGTR